MEGRINRTIKFYYYHLLGWTPFKSSRVKTSHLVILLGCFTICLLFLSLLLAFSPPQPRHIAFFVHSSHRMAFQNCLHLDFPEVERLLLEPEISLSTQGSTHMRLRTRGSNSAASCILGIHEAIQPLHRIKQSLVIDM